MAGRLGVAGKNYYDPGLMLAGQQALGLSGSKPLMMYMPPYIFPLLLPLAWFDYTPARLLWLTVHLLTLLICLDQLWWLYGGAPRQRWLSRLICQGHYGPVRFLPTTIASPRPRLTGRRFWMRKGSTCCCWTRTTSPACGRRWSGLILGACVTKMKLLRYIYGWWTAAHRQPVL